MALPQSTFRASNIVAPDLSKGLSMIQQPGNLIRGYIDREDARERQAKQDERQRLADERAQTLFDQQQADRTALQAFRKAEAQGPQTLAGVLTDTVATRPELLQGVELTATEQENANKYYTDTGIDVEAARRAGDVALADKLQRQLDLSNAVSAPEAQESRVQQLQRISGQLANSGQAIPNELVTSLNQARAAEIKVRADEKAQAAKASEGLRKEANALNLAIAKQKEKTGGYTVDADDFRENRNKLSGAVIKAASDAGIANRTLKDNGIKKATSLYDRLVKDKVHPSTAMNIVSNAIFADTSSWNPWGDSLEVSDSFIQKLKSDALRADAQLGIGVFADSASDPVMATLRDQAIDLNNRATKVNKTLARSLLTPEERQQASLAEVLGYKRPTQTLDVSGKKVKAPTKEVTFDRKAAIQNDNSDAADNPQDLGEEVPAEVKEERAKKVFNQQTTLHNSKSAVINDTTLTENEKNSRLNDIDAQIAQLGESLPLDERIGNKARSLLDSSYEAPLSFNPILEPITTGLSFMIRSGVRDVNIIKDNIAEPLGKYLKDNKVSKASKDKVAEAISTVLPGKNPFNLTEEDKKSLATTIANRYDSNPNSFLESPLGEFLIGISNKLRNPGTSPSEKFIEEDSPESFFEKQEAKYKKLKELGFTDEEIQQSVQSLSNNIISTNRGTYKRI